MEDLEDVDVVAGEAVFEARRRLGRASLGLECCLTSSLRNLAMRYGGNVPMSARDFILESLIMQEQYANEYVVHLDTWQQRGAQQRLRREVIFHHPNRVQVFRFFCALPPEQRSRAAVRYQYPVDVATG